MATSPMLGLCLIGITVVYALFRVWRGKQSTLPLPPGPKGLPILGNVGDLPKMDMLECHHWLRHKDLYGPISSVTVLGQTIVIVNDPDIAFELLRDRSSIHSSRPHQTFSGDLVGWKYATAMSQYNDYWKIHRKNITKVASSNVSVSVFDRVQEQEAAHFLMNVLDTPDRLFDHIRHEAGAVILKITYGYTARNDGYDPLVDLATRTMTSFAESTVPGRWAIDVLPFSTQTFAAFLKQIVKYVPDGLPGTGYRVIARRMRKTLTQCVEQPYAFVKQQMRENRAKPSFLSQAIESIGTDPEMEFAHKWAALSMFGAGADTTVSSLMTFFLAMSLYPEVQRKAQEELDRVIGLRLPVAADKDTLPYIFAVMLESHRWHPVLPMGLPHTSIEEDVCRGYRLPKGSMILANAWWFTHDETVYANSSTFDPDRFIETPTRKSEPDPRNIIFGYGRRICPGRYVADNALFITIAQSLTVFNITPTDKKPQVKFEPGIISHPVPYDIKVLPRSEQHRELIKKSKDKYPWEESDAKALEGVDWQVT